MKFFLMITLLAALLCSGCAATFRKSSVAWKPLAPESGSGYTDGWFYWLSKPDAELSQRSFCYVMVKPGEEVVVYARAMSNYKGEGRQQLVAQTVHIGNGGVQLSTAGLVQEGTGDNGDLFPTKKEYGKRPVQETCGQYFSTLPTQARKEFSGALGIGKTP